MYTYLHMPQVRQPLREPTEQVGRRRQGRCRLGFEGALVFCVFAQRVRRSLERDRPSVCRGGNDREQLPAAGDLLLMHVAAVERNKSGMVMEKAHLQVLSYQITEKSITCRATGQRSDIPWIVRQ